MPIILTPAIGPFEMAPVSIDNDFSTLRLGHMLFADVVAFRLATLLEQGATVRIAANFWPSKPLIDSLNPSVPTTVINECRDELISVYGVAAQQKTRDRGVDEASYLIHYPWQLLQVLEDYQDAGGESNIVGSVREGATVDGMLQLGVGSVLLPGVVIEGPVSIGQNCKIGPNCYIRGKTTIGNNCHIGHSVEVKNSIIMSNVSIGHLSYIGDSIVCDRTNIGAGTITANFRHDGKSHKSLVDGKLIDTCRRKLGAVIGADVHTGIHTSIYPGRKLWPNSSTLPGDIVKTDVR